jgi:virginiamycin A acetyltransferase
MVKNKIINQFKNIFLLMNVNVSKTQIFTNIMFGEINFPKKLTFFKNNKLYGNIVLGEGVSVYNTSIGGNILIEKYASINGPNTSIVSHKNKICIGAYSSIARNVQIQGHNHNYMRATSSSIFKSIFKINDESDIDDKGDIIIGEDVWIGTNCVILSGVKIGRGSIVAAGSVVTKDIEPYSIVGGVPAKFIKSRFSNATINELEESKWWLWETEKVLRNGDFFRIKRE